MTRPRLATGARLQYDEVREEHLLLVPEGVVRLNATAAEVLELCDGERSLDDIAGALSARYGGADLGGDVRELVQAWRRRGWWSMQLPRPSTLIAELSYQCPLHCPYCSNPLDIGAERYHHELQTEHWIRTFRQARGLGVLQLALTGGEPMLRRDLAELCEGARDAGLYSSLITAGTLFTRERARGSEDRRARPRPDLDPGPDAADNDRIAGNRSFEKKIAAARLVQELGFPLTINCVLHRQNLDRIEDVLDLALDLGAQRLELANTQYYGWAVINQDALMPTCEQLERGEEAVQRFRERVGPKVEVLWVLPDFYEDLPKPCMGGWGATAMVVAPNGDVLPVPGGVDDPGPRVRQRPRAPARVDLERVRRVRAVSRHGLDAGAVPQLPARATRAGLGRVPLPGTAAHRRRRGHRSGLPVLAASRSRRLCPRVGGDQRLHLPRDEAAGARLIRQDPAQIEGVARNVVGGRQCLARKRTARDRDAADPVRSRTRDVPRRVANHDGVASGVRRACRSGAAPGDARQFCAIFSVRAERPLPTRKDLAKAGARQLQPRDRLVVAGQQPELAPLLPAEPLEQLPDAGKHRARQIVWEQTRRGLAAALAHAVGEGVDPVARDPRADQDRARDLAICPAVGVDPRADLADVDSVHLCERSKHRLADRLPGAFEQRPVDVKQKQHGSAAGRGSFGPRTSDWYLRANG